MSCPCPTREELAAALRREGDAASEARLTAHLGECGRCRELLAELGRGGWWRGFRPAADAPFRESAALTTLIARWSGAFASAGSGAAPQDAEVVLRRLASPDRPDELGRLGRFRVLGVVACGGMSVVLRAQDPALDRVVALKVLAPVLAADERSRRRFAREARAAAAIRHDHVVAIHEVAEEAGLPFLVMELVEGEPLAVRISREGRLDWPDLRQAATGIAAGLAAAHVRGIIHGDLKPSNVLLDAATGRARLTDFGLARAVDDPGLSRGEVLAGTPEYLAPEQVSGAAGDARSDLFSLGCVFHAMATGASPFRADTTAGALRRVCEVDPMLLDQARTDVPGWFATLTGRLLAKDPGRRPASAAEVLALLESGDTPPKVQSGWFRSFRRVRIAWAGALAALVLLGLWAWHGRHPAAGPRPAAAGAPESAGPFRVRDAAGRTISAHEDIHAALAALPADGVLALAWDGPREIGPVVLPERPVTIRQQRGYTPVWAASPTNGPAILATARLTVLGPHFEYRPPSNAAAGPRGPFPGDTVPSGAAMIRCVGAELFVDGCEFRCGAAAGQRPDGFVMIDLVGSPRCELRESLVDSAGRPAVAWRGGAPAAAAEPDRLEILECGIHASDVVWFAGVPGRPVRLTLDKVSLGGRTVLFLAREMERAARFEVFVGKSVIQTDWMIVDRRSRSAPGLRAWMHWSGEAALSHPRLGYIPGDTPGGRPRVRTAEEWAALWAPPAAGEP